MQDEQRSELAGWLYVLFTDKSMILATNATDAHARDFVAYCELRKLLFLSLPLPPPPPPALAHLLRSLYPVSSRSAEER